MNGSRPARTGFKPGGLTLAALALSVCAWLGAAPALAAGGDALTVWVDAIRQPSVQTFIAAHPEIKVSIVVDDGSSGASGSLQTKIGLADQAGSGWPDVAFSTQTSDASWASQESNGVQPFAMVLNQGFLDAAFLSGFTPGALAPATIDGKVYGLRNDLAPVLFWYDRTLLDRFGYPVPKTWEDYQALGDKLAREHPGYFLGALGDGFEGPYIYFWSGEAPIFQLKGNTFQSNVSDPNARKVIAMLDHMLKNGTVTQDSLFSAAFVSKADHLVAIPGPAWFAGALFENTSSVHAKPGEWGASVPLYWQGADKVTGNVGGGIWYVSSHTTHADVVRTFVKFIETNEKTAGTGGLPAYKAAADRWLAAKAATGFYAGDFKHAVETAAAHVWGGWAFPNFSPETSWSKIIVPGLARGKTIADLAPAWEQEMKNEAQVQNYDVN